MKITTLKNALRIIEQAKELVKDGECTVSISFDLAEEEFNSYVEENNLSLLDASPPYTKCTHNNAYKHLMVSLYY